MGSRFNSLATVSLAIFALIFASGCISIAQEGPAAGELVPSGVQSITRLSLGAVVSDPGFREAYRVLFPGKSIDDEFAPVAQITGMDLRDISSVTIFTSGQGGDDGTAMVVASVEDPGRARNALEAGSGWTGTDYSGTRLYRHSGAGPAAAAVIGGHLVLGGASAVKASVDAASETGASAGARNPLLDSVFSHAHAGAGITFARLSQQNDSSMLSGQPLASSALAGLAASGGSIRKGGDYADVRGILVYGSASGAAAGRAGVESAIRLLSVLAEPGSATQKMAARASVSSSGDSVSIDVQTTLAEFKLVKAESDSWAAEQPY